MKIVVLLIFIIICSFSFGQVSQFKNDSIEFKYLSNYKVTGNNFLVELIDTIEDKSNRIIKYIKIFRQYIPIVNEPIISEKINIVEDKPILNVSNNISGLTEINGKEINYRLFEETTYKDTNRIDLEKISFYADYYFKENENWFVTVSYECCLKTIEYSINNHDYFVNLFKSNSSLKDINIILETYK